MTRDADRRPARLTHVRIVWWFGDLCSQFWLKSNYRVRVIGPESGTALESPVVIAAKHVRYADIPVVARLVRRLVGTYPFFEMGTFEGYRLLSRITGFLKAMGGFPVMRPKDVKRLQAMGRGTPTELKARMREVNAEAVRTRDAVLRAGYVFCFFPEGRRVTDGIGRMRARHEFEEAIELASELTDLAIVPVVISYPAKQPRIPFIGRGELVVRALEPLAAHGATRDELLEKVETAFRESWMPCEGPSPASSENEETAS